MKIGRLLIAATALLLLQTTAQAQDIHFSQFYASPLNLNPATTGVMPCDMRVSAIYRNQWASVMGNRAFNTFSAGLEGKFRAGTHDHYGLGMTLWADKAGSSRFSTMQAAFSASYIKKLGGRRSNQQYLTAGGQLGITQRSISTNNLTWGTQFTGDQYDGTMPSQENIAGTRKIYADFNAGLMYYLALDPKANSNVYFGIAFSHLGRANVALLNQGFEPLYMKFTVHGGGDFRVGRRFALVPNFAFMLQGPSMQSNFGTAIKFDLSKRANSSQAFHVGVYTRLVTAQNAAGETSGAAVDALIFVTRMRFGSSNIGLSYDVNVSSLMPGSRGNGAIELSYIYTLCGGRSAPMVCPTF
jgi:type IX secretion system PorP/SprF family membrane protein